MTVPLSSICHVVPAAGFQNEFCPMAVGDAAALEVPAASVDELLVFDGGRTSAVVVAAAVED